MFVPQMGTTEIVFKETENTVIAHIKLKRIYPNRCHHWRGNTDFVDNETLDNQNLNQKLDNVCNLIDFCQAFQLVNKQFKLPNHRSFCYYHSWDQSNIHEILNKETSIQRFDTFIKLAPERVIFSLNFFNEFSNELKRILVEIDAEPKPEYISTDFTELSDLVPITEIIDNSSPTIDLNYD
ncbi:hypothetical protein BpHYR1_012318 [Brachionus plicatilis]|uniref:Uncharacterized protein n=1 Tax=Brachionus plicatilis TaxID=10195 RepID=A0A3M7R721_BRAPC|nr:hypothetical protein BpHYR1_012318 [Brachionus plicatilis]